jgi:hypothetical protein
MGLGPPFESLTNLSVGIIFSEIFCFCKKNTERPNLVESRQPIETFRLEDVEQLPINKCSALILIIQLEPGITQKMPSLFQELWPVPS